MKGEEEIRPVFILSSGMFLTQKVKEKISKKKEIMATKLQLNHNNYPQIIKQITHIEFWFTQFIQLNNNNISSIEAIRHLIAPSLQQLHLSFNHITNFLSISKAQFPSLKTLGLMDNPIVDTSKLSYLYFSELKRLLFHDIKQKAIYFYDQSIFAKTFPMFIQTIKLSPQKFKQQNVNSMLKNRPKHIFHMLSHKL